MLILYPFVLYIDHDINRSVFSVVIFGDDYLSNLKLKEQYFCLLCSIFSIHFTY